MKPLRVYIGGSMNNMARIAAMNEQVAARGCRVVSSWAFTPTDRPAVEAARQDYREIMQADLLIVDCTVPSSSGGLNTEVGIALGRPIPFVLVGRSRNVFEELAYKMFDTWDECLSWLRVYIEAVRVIG